VEGDKYRGEMVDDVRPMFVGMSEEIIHGATLTFQRHQVFKIEDEYDPSEYRPMPQRTTA